MSDTDRNSDPPRLVDSEDDFERLLARSAKLDETELAARRDVRDQALTRARQALRPGFERRSLAALALGAAAALALAVWLTRETEPPPAAEVIPAPSLPIAAPPHPSPAPSVAPAPSAAAPPLERCPQVVVAKGSPVLIDDFEDRNARVLVQDGRFGSWLANGQPKARQKPRAGATAFPVAIPKGRDESRYALHFVAEQLEHGAGIDGSFAPGKCYDASSYAGVDVWAKGPGRIHVMLSMIDAIERKWGGLCDAKCYDPHRAPLDLSAKWERYSIRWKDLSQVGYGTPLPFDEKRLWSIQFFVDAADSPFDVWIDDVAFLPR